MTAESLADYYVVLGIIVFEEATNDLGIPSTADREAIREAYKKAAFASHPDRAINDDDRRERTARFQLINEAHYVLSDPRRVPFFTQYCLCTSN